MNAQTTGWVGAILLAALTATGCGRATAAGTETGPRPAGASPTEIEALFRARQESAGTRYTEADVRFMTRMIGHHAQALAMARLAEQRAASPAVRTLALRILNGQADEIATMQQWLRDRGQPVPELPAPAADAAAHHHGHAEEMPGMITSEQMRELEQARGAEFDRLFLTYMIQHHRGAVVMVHDLFSTDGAGQDEAVFKFASDVQVDQTTEVARMERMLSGMSSPTRTP